MRFPRVRMYRPGEGREEDKGRVPRDLDIQEMSAKECTRAHLHTLSYVQLFATPWTVAHQAPLSVGFSWQECCSGLPSLSPADLPNPGIKPVSPESPALARGSFTTSTTWEATHQQKETGNQMGSKIMWQ